MCSRIELNLLPPPGVNARFLYPGAVAEARVLLCGLVPGALYTVVARHVAVVRAAAAEPAAVTRSASEGTAVPVMCVTAEQAGRMPAQVTKAVTLHQVKRNTQGMYVPQEYDLIQFRNVDYTLIRNIL